MHHKSASEWFTALFALPLIAVLLTASCSKLVRQSNAPTVPCEQPAARLIPPYPDGKNCLGSDDDIRQCYSEQVSAWQVAMISLYQGEVEKRATQDACMAKLRRDGLIK